MNGLLAGISHHLHRKEDFRGRESEIEQYELQLLDAEGANFETIYATAEQLTRHNEGYPASVEDGVPPRSLAGFSDDQLLAELRRRLAQRGTSGAPDQRT